MYQLRNDVWTSFKMVRDQGSTFEDRLRKLEDEVAGIKGGAAS